MKLYYYLISCKRDIKWTEDLNINFKILKYTDIGEMFYGVNFRNLIGIFDPNIKGKMKAKVKNWVVLNNKVFYQLKKI